MRCLATVLIVLSFTSVNAQSPEQTEPSEQPARSGLVEREDTELAQVDLSVTGPPDVVATLTADDLKLKVNLKKVREFQLDRLCEPPDPEAPAREIPRPSTPVSYLFYFEQAHLTFGGRARAMDIASRLIPELVRDGSRGMLVSNASRFKVIEGWTTEPDRMLQAVKRLEQDRSQWQFYAEEEATHVVEVITVLNNDDDMLRAVNLAHLYQREELWRTDKSLRRLSMSLSMLSETQPPKAVIYFADTMRDNPGEHYLAFFNENARYSGQGAWILSADTLLAKHPFDLVVNEAVSQGIRFYPVLAEGLVAPTDPVNTSGLSLAFGGNVDSSARLRTKHARDTLANLATETGGRAFINGERPARVRDRILQDFSCVYLLSFDPSRFSRDEPLRVIVKAKRDDLKIHSRGRVVLQSDVARSSSRLLNAFLLETADDGVSGLQTNLVPSSYDRGSFTALLQVSLPGTMLPTAEWDLGASMMASDKVRGKVSGRLSVSRTGLPVVLEREVQVKPGPHEIVSVAHELTSDILLSDRRELAWPDPDRRPATCGPIALLQPTPGAFSRDGETRESGSLARAPEEPLNSQLPTALMGLVCRGKKQRGPFVVERTLVGQTRVVFPALEFDLKDDRCAQIRDVIPARVLGPGAYRYEVRILQAEATLDETDREFYVAERRGDAGEAEPEPRVP